MSDAPGPGFDLSKLPQIDKDTSEAVRNFLPGKVLGRTAALLMLTVTVLAWAGAVDKGLKEFFGIELQPPGFRFTVLFGLPSLIVAWQLFLEWGAARNQREAKKLALTEPKVPTGYFRIGPYENTAADLAAFDRADQAHNKVLDWLVQASALPLYITGDSGSGKSSLLNAFVLPKLRNAGWTVCEARAWQDPEAALREALQQHLPNPRKRPEAVLPTRELIEAVAKRCDTGLLLVLDQFEEFVIIAQPAVQAAFAALLTDLRSNPVKGVKLVLVLRREYETVLGEAGLPDSQAGTNRYEVGRFTHRAASAFMQNLGLQADALEHLLDSAAKMDGTPQLIRPITLNVLGHVINEGKQSSAATLEAGQLVESYIAQTVQNDNIRAFSRPVLEQLLTGQETKQPCVETQLAATARLKRGEVRAVLNALTNAGLARPLDRERGMWELSHDFVARAISRHLGRQRRENWRMAGYYAAPALLLALAAAAGVYEVEVAGPERVLSNPKPYQEEEWVLIPPGSFCMGAYKETNPAPADCPSVQPDPESMTQETPLHKVTMSRAFKLAKHEVTIEEYTHYTHATKQCPPEDSGYGVGLDAAQKGQLPVTNVSWQDAVDYAAWLTEKTGKHFRLPSEAEWEYAARAGTLTRRYWGDDPEHKQACDYANVLGRENSVQLKQNNYPITWDAHACDDAYVFSAPVGRFQANPWGLQDMLGNVWEWVADCYHDSYQSAPADGRAWDDGADCASARRVIRGGSWSYSPDTLRSAYRYWYYPDYRGDSLGFRLAQDL
jgi:formylglycine-generating enzyme required for sulfatase activity